MKLSIKNLFETNLSLKIFSLLLGVSFWIVFGASHSNILELEVPISFYGDSQNKTVDCPDQITVQLSGKRSDLYTLDIENIALHLNLDEFELGEHLIDVTPEKLLLPNQIKLVHWSPSNPIIMVTNNEVIS